MTDPITMTLDELAEVLRCARPAARSWATEHGIALIRAGRVTVVPRRKVMDAIEGDSASSDPWLRAAEEMACGS